MPVHKVREVISRLESEGWQLSRGQGKGSHRKYKKDGRSVTIPGQLSADLPPKTYNSIAKTVGWK
ncbi:MAG: type II toxin-antitoxin system HicA family toxin [Coriobacteriia bacterium]|nr:type II toxin-antitoxin system HicA family toxin [Coriobacteriia bacterium]